MKTHSQQGFSLVELSVVLVVIGLIIAAIMAGGHMMQAAKVNKLISEFAGYKKAALEFKDKYNAWPGDMANAEDSWGTYNSTTNPTGVTNGDGNEAIAAPAESLRAWQELTRSGLLVGNYSGVVGSPNYIIDTNVPGTAFDKLPYYLLRYETIYQQSGNALTLTSSDGDDEPDDEALSPADANTLDKKVDDGAASTGDLLAVRAEFVAATADRCADDVSSAASANYVLTDYTVSCRVVLWLDKE